MSSIGDLIVKHGPYVGGDTIADLQAMLANDGELNALRDELAELRRLWVRVQALSIEYEREPRQLASQAVGRMLQEWLW